MGIKKRKEKGILSPKELDFIQFSTEDHIRLWLSTMNGLKKKFLGRVFYTKLP